MSKPPLRPATPIDTELAEPVPDEETEIGKANQLADRYKKPPKDEAEKSRKQPGSSS
jgi:hypothetical protein